MNKHFSIEQLDKNSQIEYKYALQDIEKAAQVNPTSWLRYPMYLPTQARLRKR